MLYQHAADDRDAAIAAALSEFHRAKVVTLRPSRAREGRLARRCRGIMARYVPVTLRRAPRRRSPEPARRLTGRLSRGYT